MHLEKKKGNNEVEWRHTGTVEYVPNGFFTSWLNCDDLVWSQINLENLF